MFLLCHAWQTELLNLTFNGKSDFQKIQVIETAAFGKTLLLDSKTQSAKCDEFIYHECLVQVDPLKL